MKKNKDFSNITKHGKISGIYFNNILKNIISLIDKKKKIDNIRFWKWLWLSQKKISQ